VKILNRPAAVSSIAVFEQYCLHCSGRRNGKEVSRTEQVRRPAKMETVKAFEEIKPETDL
jgi:hypothetical protein